MIFLMTLAGLLQKVRCSGWKCYTNWCDFRLKVARILSCIYVMYTEKYFVRYSSQVARVLSFVLFASVGRSGYCSCDGALFCIIVVLSRMDAALQPLGVVCSSRQQA